MGLTGEAPNDRIHDATPRAAVEGSKIRPKRRLVQPPLFHAASQDFGRKRFPLDQADDASAWARHSESEVESADAGAEREYVEGR